MKIEKSKITCLRFPCLGLSSIIDSINLSHVASPMGRINKEGFHVTSVVCIGYIRRHITLSLYLGSRHLNVTIIVQISGSRAWLFLLL